jgi:hypothetical protein
MISRIIKTIVVLNYSPHAFTFHHTLYVTTVHHSLHTTATTTVTSTTTRTTMATRSISHSSVSSLEKKDSQEQYMSPPGCPIPVGSSLISLCSKYKDRRHTKRPTSTFLKIDISSLLLQEPIDIVSYGYVGTMKPRKIHRLLVLHREGYLSIVRFGQGTISEYCDDSALVCSCEPDDDFGYDAPPGWTNGVTYEYFMQYSDMKLTGKILTGKCTGYVLCESQREDRCGDIHMDLTDFFSREKNSNM